MREQNINIFSYYRSFSGAVRHLRLIAVCTAACLLSACIPVGDQEINTNLFTSKEDMYQRAATIEPGMSKKAVFDKICIPQDKFARMSLQEVQSSVYGNSVVQGTPEQLEQFRQRLNNYEGYSLPYRDIKSSGSLGFGSLKVNKNGYDLRLVLIFEKNRLLKASVDGNQAVNMDEDQSLFNVLLRRGTGVGF